MMEQDDDTNNELVIAEAATGAAASQEELISEKTTGIGSDAMEKHSAADAPGKMGENHEHDASKEEAAVASPAAAAAAALTQRPSFPLPLSPIDSRMVSIGGISTASSQGVNGQNAQYQMLSDSLAEVGLIDDTILRPQHKQHQQHQHFTKKQDHSDSIPTLHSSVDGIDGRTSSHSTAGNSPSVVVPVNKVVLGNMQILQSAPSQSPLVNLQRIGHELEVSLPVKTHRYHLKNYKDVFRGSDLVDYLVRSRQTTSRADAVALGRKLQRELNLFEHVYQDHELKDDSRLFYRFVESSRRVNMNVNVVQNSNSSSAVGTGVAEVGAEESPQQALHIESSTMHTPVTITSKTIDPFLIEVAELLKKKLNVRDRFYHFKRYKKCFVARDAVDVMMKNNLCGTREDAVDLGRKLEFELKLFRHVVNEHFFDDKYLFFEFVDGDDGDEVGEQASSQEEMNNRRVDDDNSSTNYYDGFGQYDGDDGSDIGDIVATTQDSNRSRDTNISTTSQIENLTLLQLIEVGDELKRHLVVKNRRYHLRLYRRCFVASEAVEFIVNSKNIPFVTTRKDAVRMGRRLQKELNLFYHVCNDHKFSDGYLFFQFDSHANSESASYSESRSSFSDRYSSSDVDNRGLTSIAKKLRMGIQIKDRRYRLKTYRRCFIGSEAVDFLVQASFALSRDDAVDLCQRIMQELHIIEHVTRGHTFKDEYLFYRFTAEPQGDDGLTCSSFDSSHQSESVDLDDVNMMETEKMKEVLMYMKNNVKVKDRIYRLKMYKNCFIACEAVDYLVQAGLVDSRTAAVALGKRLQNELKCLYHVEEEKSFDDDYLFFRYGSTEERHDSLSGLFKTLNVQHAPAISQRLQLSNIPVLRKNERAVLRAMMQKSEDTTQVVEIVGTGGNGKSFLVESSFSNSNEILYASVRFDRNAIIEPFFGMKRLLAELCKQTASSSSLQTYLDLLGDEEQISDNLFETLLEIEPDSSVLLSHVQRSSNFAKTGINIGGSYSNVRTVLRKFVVLLTSVSPVVIFIDNATTADAHSLECLQHILSANDLTNLLVCLAYRDNELSSSSSLEKWRNEVLKCISLESVMLSDLSEEEVHEVLSFALKTDCDEVSALAGLVLERSQGNVFFVLQLLEELQERGLLDYDFNTYQWSFSIEECRSELPVATNVVKFLSSRFDQLSRNTEQLLKLVSCFDAQVSQAMLQATKEVLFCFGDINNHLDEACDELLLLRCPYQDLFWFPHKELKYMAYNMLPTGNERKAIHFDIGIALARNAVKNPEDSFLLFACADQFTKAGVSSMKRLLRTKDTLKVVNIFVLACKKASSLSAFQKAADFIANAVELLGSGKEEIFLHHPGLSIQLNLLLATSQLKAGRIDESRDSSQQVILRARTDSQRLAAQMVLIKGYSATNELDQQYVYAMEILNKTGHPIGDCKITYAKVIKKFLKYSDEEILAFPKATDGHIEFAVEVICELLQSSIHLSRGEWFIMALVPLATLLMEHGSTKFTALVLTFLAQERMVAQNDLKTGLRYIELALQMEMDPEVKCRVLLHVCMGLSCIQPASKCMYLALDGFEQGMAVGDIATAFNSAEWYLLSFYYSGLPLDSLLEDAERFVEQMEDYKQSSTLSAVVPLQHMLLCLSGEMNHSAGVLEAEEYIKGLPLSDEIRMNGFDAIKSYSLQRHLFVGDIQNATPYYEELKDRPMGIVEASVLYQTRIFYFALICFANQRKKDNALFKTRGKAYMDTIRHLVVGGGAANLAHKILLLEAEYATTNQSNLDQDSILKKYEQAIVAASRAGYLQDGAISSVFCALYCMKELKSHEDAKFHMARARDMYSAWGAHAIAQRLSKRYPQYFDNIDGSTITPDSGRGGSSTLSSPRISTAGSSSARGRAHYRADVILKHKGGYIDGSTMSPSGVTRPKLDGL
mmetsp:Transcript_27823/g.67361  ORF Transcript_27823/g.67361 Transcript_27823/m.67361 type:complete len:1915 (+) Transcript_27823:417-6161(+)